MKGIVKVKPWTEHFDPHLKSELVLGRFSVYMRLKKQPLIDSTLNEKLFLF